MWWWELLKRETCFSFGCNDLHISTYYCGGNMQDFNDTFASLISKKVRNWTFTPRCSKTFLPLPPRLAKRNSVLAVIPTLSFKNILNAMLPATNRFEVILKCCSCSCFYKWRSVSLTYEERQVCFDEEFWGRGIKQL